MGIVNDLNKDEENIVDPIIFSFHMGGLTLALRWYGVLVMTGVVAAAWLAEREVTRRGEKGQVLWDAMIWLLTAGILGARLWYVVNATLGGNSYYLENPIQILNIPQGGLHIYGGLLVGGIVMLYYLRRNNMDIWLFLDAVAPTVLLGQALARPANFINQELYGQPTNLPWGIPIDADHRIGMYKDLVVYPLSTRFHPTFAYEMIWNILAFAVIMYVSWRFYDRLKPGTLFFLWLVSAGLGRFLIEFFRPDQPHMGNTWISYTQIATLLMVGIGLLMLAFRYDLLKLPIPQMPENYIISPKTIETPS